MTLIILPYSELTRNVISLIVLGSCLYDHSWNKEVRKLDAIIDSFVESFGEPTYILDNHLRILKANRAFRQWILKLGIRDNVVGRTLFEALPFVPNSVANEYEQVIKCRQSVTTNESTVVNNELIFTQSQKIPLFYNSEVREIVTIIRDITELLSAQRDLQSERDRAMLYLNLMRNDIPNKLQAVILGVELIGTLLHDETTQSVFSDVLSSIERCSQIVDSVIKTEKLAKTPTYKMGDEDEQRG
jgi:transcriptional regulator with PAS, ATPase and Fis domain